MGAALFDLDGVLVDSTAIYRRAWAVWAAAHGVQEAAIWADAHGRRPQDIISRVAPGAVLAEALAEFDACLDTATASAELPRCRAQPSAWSP